jgi:hypothetical protein
MDSIDARAIAVEGGENLPGRGQYGVDAADVEERLLLSCNDTSGRSSAVALDRTANEAASPEAPSDSSASRV